ncbi:MAG: DUF2339 domain-containing protein [Chitinophagaceae bacterium]|nr:DUF2339 domain-containing protein [Chitinophagaceae bacterium]
MSKEKEIKDIQEKVNRLTNDLHNFQQELLSLQACLRQLQLNNDQPYTEERTPSSTINSEQAAAKHGGFEKYIGLRLMHIIGIVVLVTGLSIGVKYAIDKELISEALRITLAYAAGITLFVLSLRLKEKYPLFSAILFSGGMASLYFTTYAAAVYYHFVPGIAAFGIMVALTAYTVFAAFSYDKQEIAILGMIGAYGIPFLVSANTERFELFFSYILLINLGVAYISFRRSWKLMQQLALFITWFLFTGWCFTRYTEAQFVTGIAFMLAFYVLFLVSALADLIRYKKNLLPADIRQLIINNTAAYLAAILLSGDGWFTDNAAPVTAITALVLAIMAILCNKIFPGEVILQRLLSWQAVILLVLFISLQWDNLTVTLLWIVLAILLFLFGVFTRFAWPRLAGILLTGITLGKLVIFDSARFTTVQKIISFLVIGILLLFFSFYYQRFSLKNKDAAKTG